MKNETGGNSLGLFLFVISFVKTFVKLHLENDFKTQELNTDLES